ncbi:ATP-binding protein [Maliponia aquimaris]|uniref:histidine kinase n=1 Tax=Maliponia aquimaris TaxID=1673631 RepID=A0A238KKR3_9RHOB|nr:ATP-binding protein [Maliponia aquimaris]SMX42656.1 Blue-light-activated protein [Maliponia aquimaris]
MKIALRRRVVVPLAVAGLAFLVSSFLYFSERQTQATELREETQVVSAIFAARLETHLMARLQTVQLLGYHFSRHETLSPEEFRDETHLFLELFDDLQALNWVDSTGVIRVVTPERGNSAALGLNVKELPMPAEALAQADAAATLWVTPPIELAQGGKGFVGYFPLSWEGRRTGFLNIVFRVEPLMVSALGDIPSHTYSIRVLDKDQELFSIGRGGIIEDYATSHEIEIGGRVWQVQVSPTGARVRDADDLVDEIIAVLGLVLTVFSGVLVRLLLDRQAALRETIDLQLKLNQAQKMEAIGNLTGGVAHDFNNLLSVIQGNLELIRETHDPARVQHYSEAALKASRQGAELTNQMLSFSRQSRLEPVMLDVNALVRETQAWASRVIPEDIVFELDLSPGLWPVEADRSLTQNALLNLILNAKDAMPRGGTLAIKTMNVLVNAAITGGFGDEVAAGRYVVLEVRDTGQGIPKELMSKVFDPFFTTKPVGSGTGLGLSMVQGFMKQSGGGVRVDSRLGSGTVFKLYFQVFDNRAR